MLDLQYDDLKALVWMSKIFLDEDYFLSFYLWTFEAQVCQGARLFLVG